MCIYVIPSGTDLNSLRIWSHGPVEISLISDFSQLWSGGSFQLVFCKRLPEGIIMENTMDISTYSTNQIKTIETVTLDLRHR